MPGDPFVHLHVASGYSLRYGASHPRTLVERAAEQEMDTLALTDRDGVYGAVRFVTACQLAGIRPVLGVDLAVRPALPGPDAPPTPGGVSGAPRRAPVRGGAFRDPRLPRVTLLASGRGGWARLCRLVSATHLAGERGEPVCDLDLLGEHLGGAGEGEVLALLGPGSELGRAVTLRRDDLATEVLRRWREICGEGLHVELVSHRLPGAGPGTSVHAARMAGLAASMRVPAVLSNAVRYADRLDAPTVDVLDAARRLVPLDPRHLDRGNAEGFLKSGKLMHDVAEEICRYAGQEGGPGLGRHATALLARTRTMADRCVLDPREDLGMGVAHLPTLRDAPFGSSSGAAPLPDADALLRARCEGAIGWRYGNQPRQRIWKRLDDELQIIAGHGFASYFLTVGDVVEVVRDLGIRCAARGSGAGSLVNHLLGISGVDPIRHGLLMERFLSPLRASLPDIDLDVESARRLEIYDAILDRYGAERTACVAMMETYKVRHAIRDTGAALGMPPGEIDAIAKAFPHIRARDARMALRDLPELRRAGLDGPRMDLFFRLVESLDGLPRHVAMHPCGVLLSDATLLDRTPVEASFLGYPMSQFDKDDVEELGLLKLDVLGIRMQSAMAHAVEEIRRVGDGSGDGSGPTIDLDDEGQVPFDDAETYRMISSSRTLGVFQIESPGQRELVGKSGIEDFTDIIADISLFRPGPVKSDMITPYLEAKQGWRMPSYLHESLRPILSQTRGVVVFHEQVIEMVSQVTGCGYAEADEWRRAMGDTEGMAQTKTWFFPRALEQGYPLPVVERIWKVVEAFASFGFCKAHAAAFALPTYQSAWLKAHHPAAFVAGVLTHDPGMYPKRLILDDARRLGIAVLGLDVNASQAAYVVERLDDGPSPGPGGRWEEAGWGYGIRLALSEVRGISEAEVARVVGAREDGYVSLTDFWHRAHVSRPVAERLVETGAFDSIYGIGATGALRRPGRLTRRDLLLQVADLDRTRRSLERADRGRARGRGRALPPTRAQERAAVHDEPLTGAREWDARGVRERALAQSQGARPVAEPESVQLVLDLGEAREVVTGLPEMSAAERLRAELDILGLDASGHVLDPQRELLEGLAPLGLVRAGDLLEQRSRAEILVAGVKVATQTPPVRSGRRVVFLTIEDGTGPADATFFEDAQGPYAATVFSSWLLLVRGVVRRTGRRGVSVRATGCWDLGLVHERWLAGGIEAVREELAHVPEGFGEPPEAGTRRVLTHSSGFQMSPYADIAPAGQSTDRVTGEVARRLWHRSPGSAG